MAYKLEITEVVARREAMKPRCVWCGQEIELGVRMARCQGYKHADGSSRGVVMFSVHESCLPFISEGEQFEPAWQVDGGVL